MMTNNNSTWRKSFVDVIDQRKEKLPPAWLATTKAATIRSELGPKPRQHDGADKSAKPRAIESALDVMCGPIGCIQLEWLLPGTAGEGEAGEAHAEETKRRRFWHLP